VWTGLRNVWDRTTPPEGLAPAARIGTGLDGRSALGASPDGNRLAVRTGEHRTLSLWDLSAPEKPRMLLECGQGGEIVALAWAPGGKQLTAAYLRPGRPFKPTLR